MAPNPEQQQIIQAAKQGGNGVIQAGAGTGKTSTLRMIAEAMPDKKILYIAFNRGVADEAERSFPSHVLCRNAHRLAYRPFAAQVQRRGGKYPSAKFIARTLGVQPFSYDDITITPVQIAVALKEAVGRFCTSADREPTAFHVSRTDIAKNVPDDHRNAFIAHVLPYVKRAWNDIADPKGTLPYMPGRGDNCYLKLWSLSNPRLYQDVILYDEAQDANPATAHVVEIQNCQKIMVGDSAQAIYGWNGAIDAMKKFKADWRLKLQQSYRFGQLVADQANRWLNHIPDTDLRLVGYDKIESIVKALDEPSAILCRTNAGCIESAIKAQSNGQQVAIAGGTRDIENFTKAANDLMQGVQVTHPELAAFHSWSEVQQAVQSGESVELGMMVRLIDNYGTHTILEVCRNTTKVEGDPIAWANQPGHVMVSTAHKAKGLEWDHVKIHNDFKAPQEPDEGGRMKLSVPEAMLIYVAITRAKQTLDNGALDWLDELEATINQKVDEHGLDEHES